MFTLQIFAIWSIQISSFKKIVCSSTEETFEIYSFSNMLKLKWSRIWFRSAKIARSVSNLQWRRHLHYCRIRKFKKKEHKENEQMKKKDLILNVIRENASQYMKNKNVIIICVNHNSLKVITKRWIV